LRSPTTKEFHVLNLGAGVQSTMLYLMFLRGELKPQLNYAIFADTGDEPVAVYNHLDWLETLNGPPILRASKPNRLSVDLMGGKTSTGQRFAAIPAFTTADGTTVGRTKRQCSKEYKTEPIERSIRRGVVGLQPRQRIPRGTVIHQYFGISADEAGRAVRIRERFKAKPWAIPHFPLVERFITRADAVRYLAGKVPHETPRSACVYCPYHSDAEWVRVKAVPEDWALAVRLDAVLREPGRIVNRDMKSTMFLHRSLKPLDKVVFNPKQQDRQLSIGFWQECEGVCGV